TEAKAIRAQGATGFSSPPWRLTARQTDCHECQLLIPFKSWRMSGRVGSRRATVLNPSRLNADATPVKTLRVLPGRAVSTGYASSAGALARLAAFKAAAINSDITPWRR